MNAREARHQIDVANYMRRMADDLQRQAEDGVEMPRPGCLVKDVRTGKIYAVISNGTIDGFDDRGRLQPDAWLWYDVIQEGEPELPGAPKGVT